MQNQTGLRTSTLKVPIGSERVHRLPEDETVEHRELTSDSSSSATIFSVVHGKHVQCELQQSICRLFEGDWDWQLLGSGMEFGSSNRWTDICSEINDEAAYLELQLELESGVQIERQIFLARRDGFMFLADVLKSPRAATGEYRLCLPCAAGVTWEPAAETRDGALCVGGRRVAKVLPICLPEWRAEPGGRLESTDDQLVLSVPMRGPRLQAAVFIDLDRRRFRRPVTWRRLTVGESLNVVPPHIAVGYRVQVGKLQWLIYRSLAPRGNRTVLGQNFSSEFVVARFHPDGTAEKLLEIE